ncbi:30S ribosomal protein S9 [Candidatus Dojkabacteria bacterium]|uniref:Small ribosomal subunit protein uS9 n=1 Tax=Candidatus Dojkabacteria bacterium TaxID=2099670 RepID=A0A955LAW7_9BACT|nr:30S ribosomal protein S9 [Candidatus Dojkabacteria bacterium]
MADKYYYSLGRRKTSTATVRLFEGAGKSEVNKKSFEEVYPSKVDQTRVLEPFVVAELDPKKFYFTIVAQGGGVSGQLDAIRLGLSRSIVKMDPDKKSALKKAGLMTRDPRMVERKKTGLRKARKREQFSKR